MYGWFEPSGGNNMYFNYTKFNDVLLRTETFEYVMLVFPNTVMLMATTSASSSTMPSQKTDNLDMLLHIRS